VVLELFYWKFALKFESLDVTLSPVQKKRGPVWAICRIGAKHGDLS